MWEMFANFVLAGYTLRRIRQEMKLLGYDLSEYTDTYLLVRMIKVQRD